MWGSQGQLECRSWAYPAYPLMASIAAIKTSSPEMCIEDPMRSGHAAVGLTARDSDVAKHGVPKTFSQ
jgi:hypothetical protein